MIKKVAIAVFILMIASLSIAGCTSSSTDTSNTASAGGASAGTDVSTALTNDFKDRGLVVVQPFTKSTNNAGLVTYNGVFKDGQNTLTPYQHNVTIMVANDRSGTQAQYNQSLAAAQARGYQKTNSGVMGSGTVWGGSIGRLVNTRTKTPLSGLSSNNQMQDLR
ncbi:MAG: hypothetical protein ACXV5N_10580 [Halobacteriota archaeon]